MPTAHRLAQAVKTFYQAFRLPEKDRGEMRPYLTTSYKTGSDLLSEFMSFKRDQKFTPSSDAYLLAFLKPFLLYSHGISFYDPLPWLFDFFAHRSDADFIKARLPHVTRLLLEYVKIADLIRNRVVVPVSDETFGFYAQNRFVLSDSEKREIAANSRFPEPAEFLNLVGSKVKEQLWLNQRMEDRIDLYFPNDLYVPILQGLLRAASRRYTSRVENAERAFALAALPPAVRVHAACRCTRTCQLRKQLLLFRAPVRPPVVFTSGLYPVEKPL
jgi:hypothetical protein